MNSIPYFINNGKTPEELFNAKHTYWLPPDTPYGNLLNKLVNIIQCIDHINRRIKQVYDNFIPSSKLRNHEILFSYNPMCHKYIIEEVIYWLKKMADENIHLYYILSFKVKTKDFPVYTDEVQCIRTFFDKYPTDPILISHRDFLELLNKFINDNKHSPIGFEIMPAVGIEYPVVLTLSNKKRLGADKNTYPISLPDGTIWYLKNESFFEVTKSFDEFYQQIQKEIKNLANSLKKENN